MNKNEIHTLEQIERPNLLSIYVNRNWTCSQEKADFIWSVSIRIQTGQNRLTKKEKIKKFHVWRGDRWAGGFSWRRMFFDGGKNLVYIKKLVMDPVIRLDQDSATAWIRICIQQNVWIQIRNNVDRI